VGVSREILQKTKRLVGEKVVPQLKD